MKLTRRQKNLDPVSSVSGKPPAGGYPEEPVLTPSVTEIRAYAANFGTRFGPDPCKRQNRETVGAV